MRDLLTQNQNKVLRYGRQFHRLFGLSLREFVDIYTGFDLIQFEEVIGGTKSGESLRDKIREQYGAEAMHLVTILIS